MSVPGDVEMISESVAGTPNSQILYSRQAGHLYELHFQEKAQEGWFGCRVQLIDRSVGSSVQSFPPASPVLVQKIHATVVITLYSH
jgi:hypothetical protein